MNLAVLNFETTAALDAEQAATLLGLRYVTYSQYRAGIRPVPDYTARHMEALLLLPEDTLNKLIARYVWGRG